MKKEELSKALEIAKSDGELNDKNASLLELQTKITNVRSNYYIHPDRKRKQLDPLLETWEKEKMRE
jgi:hypothetical protein